MKRKLAAAALFLIMVPITVLAQATFKKDYKDRLIFSIKPGASITHSISVINVQDTPIDIELYSTDGIITDTGTLSTLPRSGNQVNVGKWLSFDQSKIHLEGKEEKPINFTINIPSDTTPGSYAGGISLEPAVAPVQLKVTGATVSTRIVMPVFVNVEGKKVTNYKWLGFTHSFDGNHSFLLSFSNDGNTIIKVTGSISLEDYSGNITEIPMGDITLLQKATSNATVAWNEKPFFGFYKATANLIFSEFDINAKQYNEIGSDSKTLSFDIIPWTAIFIILAVIILLVIVLVIKAMLYKNFLKRCVSYQVAAGETLNSIGKKNKVEWKLLAKINRLKPPYDLTTGQKILLPPSK